MKMEGTILVVEPNGGLLTTLDILLKKHFSRVVSVAGLEKMHSALQEGGVDVLLFDLGVCVEAGDAESEVKRLSGQYPDMQIVLLATFAQMSTAVSLANSCALDYITKPWNNDKVAISVRNALLIVRLKQEAVAASRKVCEVQKEYPTGEGLHQERVSILSVLEDETLEQMELRIIKAVLSRNRGNISLTAQQLGITRQTLYNKGKKYGLID